MVLAAAGVPAAVVVLTAVDIPVAPSVANVVTVNTAVEVLPDTAISNVLSVLALVGVPAFDSLPTVEHSFC
jgi:hypothetical protein